MKLTYSKTQLFILCSICVLLVIFTSQYWIQYPDSGYYLGTASNMISSFKYWFNGQPNLQYYPGTSIVIAIPLTIFGENYLLLQAFMAIIALIGVIAIAIYFSPKQYGVVGFFVPFFVITSSLFINHFYALISDTLFLTITILALLSWRKFEASEQKSYLLICCFLVAFSALVRLQGLFFCAALGVALVVHAYQFPRGNIKLSIMKMCIVGAAVSVPFILWTLRNYLNHSPDTFNMANGYFFGLKGLSIYAKDLPGNASSESIQAAWQFPLERTSLFVGGLFESWYGGLSRINRYGITIVMLLLTAVGLYSWAKRANKLEILYVGLSMAFIAKDILLNRNLHIVYRYWLPMMPFVIVMMGLGIRNIVSFEGLKRLKKPAQVSAIGVVLALLTISSQNLFSIYKQKEKFQNEQNLIDQLVEFAVQEIPKDAIVATVDWGVLPHALQRRSVPLLNDPDNAQSIARMLKYRTNYLVTYSKFARMSEPAERMVENNPNAFKQIFEADGHVSQPNTTLKVYRVDLSFLEQKIKPKAIDS